MKKRLIILSLLFAGISMLSGCSSKAGVNILANDEEILATVNKSDISKVKLAEEGHRAYLEIVMDEAIQTISKEKGCTQEEAKSELFDSSYTIYTAFDKEAYEATKNAYEKSEQQDVSFGSAITDLKGNLIAVYSNGEENFAIVKTPPYSSFKPLSVYAPALEERMINWSTVYEDTPYKEIEQADGILRNWPANATGIYTEENVTVADAVKASVNTVAVKCLKEYGVADSVQFLKENFGLILDYEEQKMFTEGEEEIIGNIALGYLFEGVSPVEMAGYYQIFANGGVYLRPETIVKICDDAGNIVYESDKQEIQVITRETACIMNQMLQNVVYQGGTAEAARFGEIMTGGKTGTGDEGNWFVGFTPEYTCAVWHGSRSQGNRAAKLYASVMSGLTHNEEADYPECRTVKQSVYCRESGKMVSGKCMAIDFGYYMLDDLTPVCDVHK